MVALRTCGVNDGAGLPASFACLLRRAGRRGRPPARREGAAASVSQRADVAAATVMRPLSRRPPLVTTSADRTNWRERWGRMIGSGRSARWSPVVAGHDAIRTRARDGAPRGHAHPGHHAVASCAAHPAATVVACQAPMLAGTRRSPGKGRSDVADGAAPGAPPGGRGVPTGPGRGKRAAPPAEPRCRFVGKRARTQGQNGAMAPFSFSGTTLVYESRGSRIRAPMALGGGGDRGSMRRGTLLGRRAVEASDIVSVARSWVARVPEWRPVQGKACVPPACTATTSSAAPTSTRARRAAAPPPARGPGNRRSACPFWALERRSLPATLWTTRATPPISSSRAVRARPRARGSASA